MECSLRSLSPLLMFRLCVMELPIGTQSMSLSSRDLRQPLLVTVPATTSAISGNSWLTLPDVIKHPVNLKTLNFEKEKRAGEETLATIASKPRQWKNQPHNIYASVLALVHNGFIQGAVTLEELCLTDLENCIKEGKRTVLSEVNNRIRVAHREAGARLLQQRGALCLACILVIAYWSTALTTMWTQLLSALLLVMAGDMIYWTTNNDSVYFDNSVHKREQLQLEIDTLLRLLNMPVSLKPLNMTSLTYLQQIFFFLDIFLQLVQTILFLAVIVTIYLHWRPLATGVTASQLLIYLTLLALHGCVVWTLLLRQEERSQIEDEEEALSMLLSHFPSCIFNEKINAYQFAVTKPDNSERSFFITRSVADYRVHEWSFFNKSAIRKLKKTRYEFRKAVWRSKFRAVEAKVVAILRHLTTSGATGVGTGERRAFDYYSDIFFSNQQGLCLCYFALLDLFEGEGTQIDPTDKHLFDDLLDTMHEIEKIEMHRMHQLVSHKSLGSPERYNQILYFATSKRIIFHPEAQLDVFQLVRNYLIRYFMQSVKIQCELPLSTLEEGKQRLKRLTAALEETEMKERRANNEATQEQEQSREYIARVEKALFQLDHQLEKLSVRMESEARKSLEKSNAIAGPREPNLRATHRYYHPSLFRVRGEEVGEGGRWDCCGKPFEDSVGCRVDYIQKGHVLKVYHHPLPWREGVVGVGDEGEGAGGLYECCLEESRSAKGCVEGFHPCPFSADTVEST